MSEPSKADEPTAYRFVPSITSDNTGVHRDPDYDWIPPLATPERIHPAPRGRQCGECGMKFEYGHHYGYSCPRARCPAGWGSNR